MTNQLPNTLSIGGYEFDNPLITDYPLKHRFKVEKVGERKTVSTIWVDHYLKDGYEAYALTLSNGGVAEIEGKKITNKDEIEIVKQIFNELKDKKEK